MRQAPGTALHRLIEFQDFAFRLGRYRTEAGEHDLLFIRSSGRSDVKDLTVFFGLGQQVVEDDAVQPRSQQLCKITACCGHVVLLDEELLELTDDAKRDHSGERADVIDQGDNLDAGPRPWRSYRR